MNILRLVRYPNLLMLALMQVVFRYGFYRPQGIIPALFDYQFVMLVVATVSIAAAGYIINDISDVATDRINKPGKNLIGNGISEQAAWRMYVILNIIGVGCGFFISHAVGRPWFTLIFMVMVLFLYQYATNWKRMILVGNLAVAFMTFTSVIILGLFDLFPILTIGNRGYLGVMFGILLDYAIFAFIINLIREIVKDMQDINGDYNQGMNTLPIAIGIARTVKMTFWLSLLPVAVVLWYIYTYFYSTNLFYAVVYSLVLIAAPLIYFSIRIREARTSKDFGHLSTVLKLIMLTGILSILVVSYNVLNHA